MLQRISLAVLILFGGFIIAPVRADENTGRPLIVAVGIDKFQDPQIKPRKHAEADAKALVDWFVAKENLGADIDRVKLLLGSGGNAPAPYPIEKATKDN